MADSLLFDKDKVGWRQEGDTKNKLGWLKDLLFTLITNITWKTNGTQDGYLSKTIGLHPNWINHNILQCQQRHSAIRAK